MTDYLQDGTEVRIRAIRSSDKRLLGEGMERLSDETRRLRFLASKPRLSPGELRYLTEIDHHNHIALVATPAQAPERIVGVARSVRLAEDHELAEFAIVVCDELQGRGLGRLLASRLVDAAQAHGVRGFTASILPENTRAIGLARSIAERLTWAGDGTAREYMLDFAA